MKSFVVLDCLPCLLSVCCRPKSTFKPRLVPVAVPVEVWFLQEFDAMMCEAAASAPLLFCGMYVCMYVIYMIITSYKYLPSTKLPVKAACFNAKLGGNAMWDLFSQDLKDLNKMIQFQNKILFK